MDLAVGRNLVRRWRTGGRGAPPAPASTGPAPVSSTQRGCLVFERLCPRTAVFNLCLAARHTGQLDEDRLGGALTALVRRHPALRSTFGEGADGPVRIVRDTLTVAVEWTDLRPLPSERRATTAREHAERLAAEPFDLGHGPLVRVHGCRLADDERLLIFVAHHLVCDGASMRILLGELDAAYRGELTGQMPDAAPPPVAEAALAYWRTRLAELPDLDLPADRARPAEPTFRAASVPLTVPKDVVVAAEQLGRGENATLFMVALAAFQLLLGEHSGLTDFAVGSPEAGRARPGQHDVVGLLSDLLVLRADLRGRPSFRELVRRARTTLLAALAHREAPFSDVVAAVAPGRQLDGALVQATIVYHGEWSEPTLAGSPLERMDVARAGLRHAVELHLWREEGQLRGSWDYQADTFEPASAARMARRLAILLSRVLAEPDRPVDQLDLLTDEERGLLRQWSAGPDDPMPDTTLPELFAAQVASTPDAIAIRDPRRELTYRQLDERSNQLAHYLRDRSVGSGEIVGIRLARSVDLAVAMLGIFKVGAAYLPLDPAYPADRTDYMLRDSAARTVVADAELGALAGQPMSTVDGEPVAPDQLACVLYTSGSTGRPKGVLLTHRNVVGLVLWGRQTFSPAQLSKMLAASSICFDVSVFELFGPLCVGGTVVVVDSALSLLTDSPDVTMFCAVPTATRALVDAGALPRSVRVACLGGEAVTGTLADDLYATGHVDMVLNCYGPTETTIYSTGIRLLPAEQPPPIGSLLPHERGYVLDRALRQAPVGAVGELYLAGRGLSRGYNRQPALTAHRYVADPFSPTPGERMYRTGDLVRYRSDGALLYLGRRDFQIKVRGQRIELGEIETTLQRHPEVREAVVALHGGRLVGYLTARRPAGLSLADVRAYLRGVLPVVMVPSSLVVLDALPQTPNGKVDRLALPAPAAPTGMGGNPPRGPDEELVAEVWQQLLKLDTVGRDDDFFHLGGDSLLAGQVLSRLRERAGAELSLRLVFEHSRLADLAAALPERTAVAHPSGLLPLAKASPQAEPVLSYEQQRLWLDSQLSSADAYNIHGRRWLHGPLDVPVLERSIRAIVHRHATLRTTFALVDGRVVQRVAEPDPGWRIRVEDLSASDSDAVATAEQLADDQSASSFDLAAGPLFDCLLVRCGDTEHLLSIAIHHIIADAWSIGLFLRELSALYRVGGEVGRADLPALPVQYLDYAIWQRSSLTGSRVARQVEYWRDRLTGAPPALTLPVASRVSPSQGAVGGRVHATVRADDVAALHGLCRDHDVTAFMAVLASLATVLRRWSGQDDLVIGVPVNTRGDTGAGALIGLFVNTVPLRVELTGDPAFSELLSRVRQAALDGYVNHGETPFEVLVRELRVVRDPSRTPLFQVLLTMVDADEKDWRLPGIVVETAEPRPQPSKADLDLTVRHGDGILRLDLRYHADRYAAATMQALVDQIGTMVAAVANDPTRGILEYELDRRPVAEPAKRSARPARDLALAHHARRRPDRSAVIDRAGSWTYRQLADAAARVAGVVDGCGASKVGVVVRRSAGFVAAVLGCARAAVPYTIVEPGAGPTGTTLLDPDPADGAPDGMVDVRALLCAAVGEAANSGADQTAEFTDWAVERFDLTGEDRIAFLSGNTGLLMSALSTAVAAGGTLLFADETVAGDPDAWVPWLRSTSATVAYLTAPLLRALATHAVGPALPLLRYAFLRNSGDLTAHDVELLRRLAPACQAVGVYRPEPMGQPLAAYAVPRVRASTTTAPLRVPIGSELAGPAVLLNPAGRPAAIGEVAELCLGTSRRGDLVRRRADHLLEFVGPADDPLEAVAALRDLPDVWDAVVTEYVDPDGRATLAAYVVNPERTVDLGRLRQHLVTHLPEYLIPRQVVVLNRLPLTADGDYDLAALPDPEVSSATSVSKRR